MTAFSTLFGVGGGKATITTYTSGTGTYIPTADNAQCRVTIVGGGGGGASTSYCGMGAGVSVGVFRVPISGAAYAVGAGGAVGATGGKSSFFNLVATGGNSGVSSTSLLPGNSPGMGNVACGGGAFGMVTTTGYTQAGLALPVLPPEVYMPFISGFGADPYFSTAASALFPSTSLSTQGGNSLYGTGGTSTVPASGYGAGGYINQVGTSGLILIEDFGA